MTSQERAGASGTSGTEQAGGTTSRISRFTFSEDWAAVVVGLAILLLALAGIITEDWLIL